MINLKFKDIRMREKIISKFKYSCEQNENSCRFGNKFDLCAKKGPRCWPRQDYCFVYLDFNFPTTFHILIFNGNILHYSSFIDSVLRFSSDQQEQ